MLDNGRRKTGGISVVICTCNPDEQVISYAVRSIANQTRKPTQVLIVDNASLTPLDISIASSLMLKGIPVNLVREEKQGLTHARRRAIAETESEWVVWVDDDNELDADFLANGIAFIEKHPEVGCFGGVLELPGGVDVEDWTIPFLGYLGIRNFGAEPIIKMSDEWGPWEPAGAGAWVHRKVLDAYYTKIESAERATNLGRKGALGLSSSEDSLMMRLAANEGLANAYCPELRLTHHIAPHRLRFDYLLPLLTAYGRSEIELKAILEADALFGTDPSSKERLREELAELLRQSDMPINFRMSLMANQVSHYFYRQDVLRSYETASIPITLVTACLNAGSTIERTLKSIESQAYPNLEYIVYDGGSTDQTLSVLDRYRHLTSKVVSEKDKGVAHAINKGFENSTGQVRCFLNADDCLEPDALRIVSALFNSNPDVDVVTGACRRIYADGSEVVTQVPDRFLRVMSLRNDIEQPSTFWRADLHKRCGKLDETLHLAFDWEWWNRLKLHGGRFKYTKKILSTYYFSDDNLTSRGGSRVVHEMYEITKRYASARIADAYMRIYDTFDLDGYFDQDAAPKSDADWQYFKSTMALYEEEFGREVVESYNWNWASKQVRGKKWY